MAISLLLAVITASPGQSGQSAQAFIPHSLEPYTILTPESAYILMPPVLAAEPDVKWWRWSRDGKSVIACIQRKVNDLSTLYMDPKPVQEEIVGWNIVRNTVVPLLRVPNDSVYYSSIDFIGETSWGILAVESEEQNPKYFLVSSAEVKALSLPRLDPENRDRMVVSDDQAVFLVQRRVTVNNNKVSELTWFNTSGNVTHRSTIAEDINASHFVPGSSDLILMRVEPTGQLNAAGNPRMKLVGYSLKPGSASVKVLTQAELEKTMDFDDSRQSSIQVVEKRTPLEKDGQKSSVTSLYLTHEDAVTKPILVTANGTRGETAPWTDYIGYQAEGALFIRPVAKISRAEFDKLAAEADRKEAMDAAKQVGTAIAIYAADYDDALPMSAGWQDSVMPYIKNADMLTRFSYALNGKNMQDIKDPSNTVLGFVQGKGGRAVTYADGSVRWIGY